MLAVYHRAAGVQRSFEPAAPASPGGAEVAERPVTVESMSRSKVSWPQ
jgi:hypothetical protein